MELKEKERTLIQDLQTQEQSCVEKYGKYAAQAKDPELKSLFETIQKEEQKHYDTLQQVLDGSVPACDCNDTQGKDYEPKVTYGTLDNSEDKSMMHFWQRIVSEQRSWCPANIIPMCLHLRIPHFGNCWPISRSKSRTMRK